MYKVFSRGLLGSNTYLAYDEASLEGMIIDCGNPPREPLSVAHELGVRIKYIILTHGHYDHAEFVEEYARLLLDAKVVAHEAEIAVMVDSEANVSQLFGTPRRYMHPDCAVREGDKLMLGKKEYGVISTPGHTPGSICLYSADERVLFTGDTLFCRGYGRTDFKYGSDVDMISSLRRLSYIDGDVTVLPGHGGATTVADELR